MVEEYGINEDNSRLKEIFFDFLILHTAALRSGHIHRHFTASRPLPADEASPATPLEKYEGNS
jgi:hypothetical protein